jgi:hypothetical protein
MLDLVPDLAFIHRFSKTFSQTNPQPIVLDLPNTARYSVLPTKVNSWKNLNYKNP